MASQATSPSQIITLPKRGGAQHGLGEKFSPGLHTDTGNFTVPVALPPGRNGFQPQLNRQYSTWNGNDVFGPGWALSFPGLTRKTSDGIPQYQDATDVFILSGAENLGPVNGDFPGIVRYQPRTEGLFARTERIVAHEIGHTLGLCHPDEAWCIQGSTTRSLNLMLTNGSTVESRELAANQCDIAVSCPKNSLKAQLHTVTANIYSDTDYPTKSIPVFEELKLEISTEAFQERCLPGKGKPAFPNGLRKQAISSGLSSDGRMISDSCPDAAGLIHFPKEKYPKGILR